MQISKITRIFRSPVSHWLILVIFLRSMVDQYFNLTFKEGGFTHASHQST